MIDMRVEPLELRYRYDFTDDLTTVCMINGDDLDECETEEERQELLKEFEYLSSLDSFAKSSGNSEEILKHLSLDTAYVDFVTYGEPEKDGNGYYYREWLEDDKGNKAAFYEEHHCEYAKTKEGYTYQMPDDTDMGLPGHTRTLADGEVIYDWRHQEDYVAAHYENGEFVGAHRKEEQKDDDREL